jgi:hypothetical protein
MRRHEHFFGIPHDVAVGHDDPGGIDDKAGTHSPGSGHLSSWNPLEELAEPRLIGKEATEGEVVVKGDVSGPDRFPTGRD